MPMDAKPLGVGEMDQDWVGVTEKVEVELAEALGVEELDVEALEEGVVVGLPEALPLPEVLGVMAGEEERVKLARLDKDATALPLMVASTVKAGLPVGFPMRLGTPLEVGPASPPSLSPGLPLSAGDAEGVGESEGLRVALGESVVEGVALGLAEVEAEALGDGVGSGEELEEGEAEGEGEALPLPLGEALVEMLPVAVPGGGRGASASPYPPFNPAAAAAAPRLVGVLSLDRTAAWVLWEVFVAVRVEVKV